MSTTPPAPPEETVATEETTTKTAPKLSKNAMKRLAKAERLKAKWKQTREKKKEEKRKRKEEAAAAGTTGTEDGADAPKKKKPKGRSWKEVESGGGKPSGTIAIDLGFCDLMTEKESRSLMNQICYSYGANGREITGIEYGQDQLPKFFEISVTSFAGKIEPFIKRFIGVENWRHLTWERRHFTEVFEKEKLVYLTSESDVALTEIDPGKVYVIGGLVDHNRLKGITHADAVKRGLATARLPIGEFLEMNSRKVLAVNHVFEIMLAFVTHGDWGRAIEDVLPQRKEAHLKKQLEEAPIDSASSSTATTMTQTHDEKGNQ